LERYIADGWTVHVPVWRFATVRHRRVRAKGTLSATTAKLMILKLVKRPAFGNLLLKQVPLCSGVVGCDDCSGGHAPYRPAALIGAKPRDRQVHHRLLSKSLIARALSTAIRTRQCVFGPLGPGASDAENARLR
jgi:hypothetical protein